MLSARKWVPNVSSDESECVYADSPKTSKCPRLQLYVFKFVAIKIRTIVRTPYIRMILFHEVRRRRNAASVLVHTPHIDL